MLNNELIQSRQACYTPIDFITESENQLNMILDTEPSSLNVGTGEREKNDS